MRVFRIARLVVPALLLGVAACSDRSTAPPVTETNPDIATYQTPCSSSDIRNLVKDIFPGPLGTLITVKINLYIALSATGPNAKTQAKLMELVADLLNAVNNGQFANNPVKLRKVESLIKLLFCVLGKQAPPLDLVNGGAAVVTPTTGAVVGAKDPLNPTANDAATEIKPGDVPANVPSVVVSVVPITGNTGPLDTPLQQRGPFYEFTTTPAIRFANPVLVGACLNKANDESDNRVRFAHNLNPSSPVTPGNIRFGNIEIISPESDLTSLDLSCDPLTIGFLEKALDLFLPTKLYAGGLGTGGRGGKVSEYSPFGGVVVEPLGFGLSNWLFRQPSTGDATIPSTTQGAASVPFFAEGGATTPVNGVIAQGTWTFGSAPFGEVRNSDGSFAPQCNGTGGTINYDLGTASLWLRAGAAATTNPAQYTYLLARRVFYSASATDKVQLALDNDIRTWINGVEVTSYTVDGQNVSVTPGSFLVKEGCAATNQVLVSVPRSGVNVISVQARDRGVASYFDAAQAPGVIIE